MRVLFVKKSFYYTGSSPELGLPLLDKWYAAGVLPAIPDTRVGLCHRQHFYCAILTNISFYPPRFITKNDYGLNNHKLLRFYTFSIYFSIQFSQGGNWFYNRNWIINLIYKSKFLTGSGTKNGGPSTSPSLT